MRLAETVEIGATTCDVFDVNRVPVPVDIVPITQQGGVREYLIFFKEPIEPDDSRAPVTLRVQDRVRGALGLRAKGKGEVITKSSRADRPIDTVEIVVHLPKDLSGTLFASYPDGPGGVKMSPAELTRFPTPPEYRTFGWKGTNVPPDVYFGCILIGQ